jgi:hypothetical protein
MADNTKSFVSQCRSTLRLFFVTCILSGSVLTGFSQQPDNMQPIVQLGNVKTDNNMKMKITKAELFSNPTLRCKLGGCEVTGFSIAIAPNGETISGPYKTQGATINEAQLKIIRDSKNPVIKLFIEDILVKNKGRNEHTKPLVLICVP